MASELLFAPFGAVVNIILAQAKDSITVCLKPFILTLVSAFHKWDGVPVGAVTLDDKTGAAKHEVTNEPSHLGLCFIGDFRFTKPILNDNLNSGALGALVLRSPSPLTLARAKVGTWGDRWFCFVSLAAPFTYKFGRRLVERVRCSLNGTFPFIQALVRTASPLAVCNGARPFPKLLAAHFAVEVNAGLRGHGYTLAGLRPAFTGAVDSFLARCRSEYFPAYFARFLNLPFVRFARAFPRTEHFVVVFLAARRAFGHRILQNNNPPAVPCRCLGDVVPGGCTVKYIQFA